MTSTLTPPSVAVAEPASFTLEPPAAVTPIAPESASGRVRLKPEAAAALDAQVNEFVAQVSALDAQDQRFRDCVQRIHQLGDADIAAAASVSNRMLERPVQSLRDGVVDGASGIGGTLVDLRRTVEDLDPSRQGDLLAPRRLLGLIPFGSRLVAYFERYQSAQTHLNAIIESLRRGKDELMRDNAAIEQEKARLWQLMEKLEQHVYIGRRMDGELESRAAQIELQDPEKARVVREEMLFYMRQKVMDLLTQLSVSIQGYLALDMLRKNNLELIKGVDRATTTTVSALRTAVIVAQALANQKLVLDQIQALNTTTGRLIESTSEMLRRQTGEIHAQAASSTIDIQHLQRAFDNIYQTMDAITHFKQEALGAMQTTVQALETEVGRAREHLDRTRQAETLPAGGGL
ncbi:MAG: hypothetical protein RLY78_1678 [Pseudomonadota bacterium]|jgi:uncharacterized protein YaaN involved in tellurite resistance